MNKIPKATIDVRFRDCDMMGHVNNAVYLSYFEQARMHYFKHMIGGEWNWKAHGIILVHNELTYHAPVFLQDRPEISMHLLDIGKTSFTLGYKVMVDGAVKTSGKSKLVCFDFEKNTSVPVYQEMIDGFRKLEE
jgi:acyl-CoA thioester hydrolase